MLSSVKCRHVARVVFLLAVVSSGPKVREREVFLSCPCLFYFWRSSQGNTIVFLSLGKGRSVHVDDDFQTCCLLPGLLVNSTYALKRGNLLLQCVTQGMKIEVWYIRKQYFILHWQAVEDNGNVIINVNQFLKIISNI